MRIDVAQLTSMYHPKMIELLVWLEESTGLNFTVTSLHRPDDSGVHGTMPLRATDLSCRIPRIGEAIEEYVNEMWDYDPSRPGRFNCCRFHKVRGGKWHLHMQVHPNTRRK